jgi:tRNA A-37 threonylcarbamoyl transferase component Bud32
MAFLEINPRYRPFLEERALDDLARLQALPAVIVSGHPDRQVARVVLGSGPSAMPVYVKREHRVPWKTRMRSAWAGFGLASKSYREFQVLQSLRAAGIDCPEPIAAGEDGRGRAVLIIRDATGALDLRTFLHMRLTARPGERRAFARQLGEALARIHEAGFDQPDLVSKHVLVDPGTGKVCFLDWQRSRRRRHLSWRQRWHDLAALDATLVGELAPVRDRLACLRAYLRATIQTWAPRGFRRDAVARIRRQSLALQRKRRIRELRQVPLAPGSQNLIWLDGEALCVTRAFHEEVQDRQLDWLQTAEPAAGPANRVRQSLVGLPRTPRAHLVRRWSSQPFRWLWACLRRKPLTSPELEQAGTLFRLQRFGIGTPRLLAVGQRHPRPWRTESFLLTAAPARAVPLVARLAGQARRPLWTAERKQRRRWVRGAAQVLRRLHDAGCYAAHFGEDHFMVRLGPVADQDPWSRSAVVLGSLKDIQTRRGFHSARRRRDLAGMQRAFGEVLGSHTDELRFLLAYLGLRRLTPAAKRLARQLKGEKRKPAQPPLSSFRPFPSSPFHPAEKRTAS